MNAKVRKFLSDTDDYRVAFETFLANTDQKVNARAWMDAEIQKLDDTDVLVDAGAGNGELTKYLVDRFGSVIAIEPNPYLLEQLKVDCPDVLTIADGILGAKVPPQSASLAVCSHVFYYIQPELWQDNLQQIASWLKPGGKAWIILQRPDTDCMKMRDHFGEQTFSLQPLCDQFVESHGEDFDAVMHSIDAFITTKNLKDAYVIAEFMMNMLPLESPPDAADLEAYVEQYFAESPTSYRFSCTQNVLELTRKNS
ncbi:class I SAM-dependent methyltransferase [Blastopirellula sp. JC732]|uniref:Class I SAM-dependent methyltransferase n=1 Tax=Blastopirellula sediminis TaxID=2894196 RepID=A0A9X1SGL4_9BACT|nr:class I SAM-dependent methyltransferase [Blastopirellula sediminis]MCC9607204.1 class I SAM-dependent methyltransferase [Blastopirellula sediminis]MCC9629503.1 class I SAM-dependent methyltransferase [Blastopirellula sediminis]